MNPRMGGPRPGTMGPGMGPMGPSAYGPRMGGPPPNSMGPGGPGPGPGPGPGMPPMSMGGPGGPRQPWTPNTTTVSCNLYFKHVIFLPSKNIFLKVYYYIKNHKYLY